MIFGAAYYPEQWPPDRWPVDARLMRETGVEIVRVAEHAWSRLEPRRGQYDFGWLREAVEVLAAEGLKVVLATPTASPPTWLFNRHPSMVPQDKNGLRWYPGSTRHVCLNNRPYRRYVRRIVRECGRSLGGVKAVAAWQIDTYLGAHGGGRCYCDDCEQAFREWLRGRYGTIDRLNKLWGTAAWSQEFGDWHLICAPRRTPASPHPSLVLDYERFLSATVRDFIREQREIIEHYEPEPKTITTICLGLETDHIEQPSVAGPLDVVSIANFPRGAEDVDETALHLDLARSSGGGIFWVLEQRAGATTPGSRGSQPRPGQLRLWSYQAAARGAGLLCYFRWRTHPSAQQMHWSGLLEADGTPARHYEEVRDAIREIGEHEQSWAGRGPDAQVAVVLDYHSHWALRAPELNTSLDYLVALREHYGSLRRRGLAVDVIQPGASLDRYRAVFVPMPAIVRPRDAIRWQEFVEQGGVLVVTAPAGSRTEHNSRISTPPGPLADLLGVHVVEEDLLAQGFENSLVWDNDAYPALGVCSVVQVDDAEVLARYESDFYSESPALTIARRGEGAAYYLATVSNTSLVERLHEVALDRARVSVAIRSADDVELIPLREDEAGVEFVFALNHGNATARVDLPDDREFTEVLSANACSAALDLKPYSVALLRVEPPEAR